MSEYSHQRGAFTPMPFDLFISYARRDNAPLKNHGGGHDRPGPVSQLVVQISRDFEQFAGRPLRPFFDTTEIHGMEDWKHRILQGLRESRLLLACLSPSYLASKYCKWEFTEYLNHEVARGFVGEGVAPLYFVEVPGWQDQDFEQRCAEWVADLRRRNQLDLRPWFNEGEHALRHADVQARMEQLKEQIGARIQRGERAEQSLGNVDASNPNFIGRVTELRRLRETVALGKVGVLTAVHGLGGMGKTALAIEYAHAFAHEYGGGRWQVRCEGRDNLAATIATLAPALRIEFTDAEKLDSDLQFQRVLAELHTLANAREPHRCLLLLDNVDQPKLLEPAQSQRLPAADWLHVIATTRLGDSDLFGRHQDRAFLPVDELPEADALALIESFQLGRKFAGDSERGAAVEIVRLLGRFTLAVEAAAVYLGQFAGDVTCAGFLARLKKDGLEGLEGAARETTEGVLHGEKSLAATLRPTLERLQGPEKVALTFGALLPADQIALPWVRALVAQEFPELGRDAEAGYPDPWQSVLRRFLGLRLWQPTAVKDADGDLLIVRMHRLLQELLRTNAGTFAVILEHTMQEHIGARMTFLWEGWVHHEHRWELGPLTACAWQWLDRSGDFGPFLASGVGVLLQHLGDSTESERLQRRSVESMSPDHPRYSSRINNLAQLLMDTNREAEAEPLLRQSLKIDEQVYGPDHQNVANDLNSLAGLLQATDRQAEAEPLIRRALAIVERSNGPDHPNVATCLNTLAQLLEATNRQAEAEPLLRRGLAIVEQSYGPEHPDVGLHLHNLARLLLTMDRHSEAEPLIRRALGIHEQSYGPEHPDVARDLNTLAALLKATKRLDEAEPLLRRALEITEKTLDEKHPHLVTSLNNLAELMYAMNRLAEAEPLLRRALEIVEQNYGPDHRRVAFYLNKLGALLRATGQLEEAESLLRSGLEIDERTYGSEHSSVAMGLNNLAQLLQDMNRLDEAEPLMRRVLAIHEKCYGREHPEVASDLDNLGQLLRARKRLAKAEPLQRRSLKIVEKIYPPDHPEVALHLNNLAALLIDRKRMDEAEPLMRRALAIDEQCYGPDHPDVAMGLNNLVQLLKATDRVPEAEPLMVRTVQILLKFEASSGHRHPYLLTAINDYAGVLTKRGLSRQQVGNRLNKLGREFGISFDGGS